MDRLPSGLRSTVVLCAATLSTAGSIGLNSGIAGALTLSQARWFNISIHDSSWASAVNLFCYLILSPACAALTRIIPIRYVQVIGGLITSLGIGLCYLATEPWMVTILYGLLTGVGISMVRTSSAAILPHHFKDEKLIFAIAIVMLGFPLGLTVFPILTNYLFTSVGFSYAMLILSPMMTIHILCALSYSESSEHQSKESTKQKQRESIIPSILKIIKDPEVWALGASGFFRKFGSMSFFALYPDYLVEVTGFTPNEVYTGSMVLGCCAMAGMMIIVAIHNVEFDRVLPHLIVPLIMASLMIVVTMVKTEALYFLVMCCYGLSFGMLVANLMAMANKLGGGNEMVFIYALELFVQAGGCLAGPPLVSLIEEKFGKAVGLYCSAGSMVIGGLTLLPGTVIGYVKRYNKTSGRQQDFTIKDTLDPKKIEYEPVLPQASSESAKLLSSDDESE